MPSLSVTDDCTIFAKTSSYGKKQHPQGNHLHQRQGGGCLRLAGFFLRKIRRGYGKYPYLCPRVPHTQTQTNPQPNMHLTHNPSSITHNLAEKHTFSSKERDTETGLSYFGARYYSSELSLWLSVDPMSDKYPHQSNYVYCSNNPLKVIDPNGEDEWDLARDGTLTKRENGRTDMDVVHATTKDGEAVDRHYKSGTIGQNMESYSMVLYEGQSEEISFTTDVMTFTDMDIATDFFEFAAENTEVEWALNIGKAETIVGTSHQEDFNQVRIPKDVQFQIHSHWKDSHKLSYKGPNGMSCPTCDIPMMTKNPNTFKVYEAFNRRYVSMDDRKNFRFEISHNLLKSINLFQKAYHPWLK